LYSAARHTAPAERVPSLASALIKFCMARINYANDRGFWERALLQHFRFIASSMAPP
jgi:hypothetical protein